MFELLTNQVNNNECVDGFIPLHPSVCRWAEGGKLKWLQDVFLKISFLLLRFDLDNAMEERP